MEKVINPHPDFMGMKEQRSVDVSPSKPRKINERQEPVCVERKSILKSESGSSLFVNTESSINDRDE